MIKYKCEGRYYLIINNIVVKSVVLSCPTCTDMQVEANWLYDLSIGMTLMMFLWILVRMERSMMS